MGRGAAHTRHALLRLTEAARLFNSAPGRLGAAREVGGPAHSLETDVSGLAARAGSVKVSLDGGELLLFLRGAVVEVGGHAVTVVHPGHRLVLGAKSRLVATHLQARAGAKPLAALETGRL